MKITDKQRLDWLEKSDGDVVQLAGGDHMVLLGDLLGSSPHPRGKTIRRAIDAAIRASRSQEPGRGGKP